MLAPVVSFPSTAIANAPSAATARSQPPAAEPSTPRADDRVARSQNTALQALMHTIRQSDSSLPPEVRAELDVDKTTNRVVARVVSLVSGEVVRQYPSEETLNMLARAREQFGRLLRAEA
jgi:uncharacterized FlaG/YvyC family protein